MHRIGPFTTPKGEGPVATTNDAIQQLIKTMNAISGVQLELKVTQLLKGLAMPVVKMRVLH